MNTRSITLTRLTANMAILLAAGATFSCMSGGGLSRAREYVTENNDPRVVELEAILLRDVSSPTSVFKALGDHAGLVEPRHAREAREAVLALRTPGSTSGHYARGLCTVQNDTSASMRMRPASTAEPAGPLVLAFDADILHKDKAEGGIRVRVDRLAYEHAAMILAGEDAELELAEFVGDQVIPDGGGVVFAMEHTGPSGASWSVLALFADASTTSP